MMPPEQAKFWLATIKQLEERQKLSATEYMGAALLLDAPSYGYLSEWASRLVLSKGTDALFPERARLTRKFWDHCSSRCTELARLATEAEPDNKELWRTRAILLFSASFGAEFGGVRDPNWLNVLHEARSHDSDNALYDYLAAAHCWGQPSKPDYDSNAYESFVVISDQALYDAGWRHFYNGQERRQFVFPTPHRQWQYEFARLHYESNEAARIGCETRVEWHELELCRKVKDQLNWQSAVARKEGNPDFAAHVAVQQLKLHQQVGEPRLGLSHRVYARVTFAQGHQTLRQLQRSTPELVASHKPLSRYNVNFNGMCEHAIETATDARAASRFGLEPNDNGDPKLPGTCQILLYGLGCFVVGLAVWLVSKRFTFARGFVFGWRSPLVFGGALLVSIVLQGLIPAEVLSGEVAGWTVFVVGEVVLLTVIGLMIHRWFVRPQSKAPIRKRIFIPAVLLFGFAYSCVLLDSTSHLAWKTAQSANSWSTATFQAPKLPPWGKAVFVWTENRGAECSLAAGFIISSLWIVLRLRRQQASDSGRTWMQLFGQFIVCWCRPVLATGLVLCTTALLSLPSAARSDKNWAAYRLAYCSSETLQQLVEDCREEVLNDSTTMQKINANATAHANRLNPESDDFYISRPAPSEDGGNEGF